ncbi:MULTISPECIES: hypothetical protein [Thalassobacillus]|uniref:hypothetical protein n=1 Tax=Thalassobacillus TaxID=331971 RepID=UPI000A1CBB66|nr:hypothetical protein [Thalassobacillus devorans]
MKKKTMTDPIQLQQMIIYYKAELAKYKEKVKDYQENYHYSLLTTLKEQNIELLEENERVTNQLSQTKKEMNKKISNIASQLKSSRYNEEKLNVKLESLEEKLVYEEICNKQLISKEKKLRNEIIDLKSSHSRSRNEIIQLQKTNQELNENLNESTKEFQVVKENLRKQAADLSEENETRHKKIIKLENTIKELEHQNKEQNTNIDQFKKEICELQEKHTKEIDSFQKKIDKIRKAHSVLNTEKEQLEKENQEIAAHRDNLLAEERSDFEKKLKSKEEIIEQLKEENFTLSNQVEKLKDAKVQTEFLDIFEEADPYDMISFLDSHIKTLLEDSFDTSKTEDPQDTLIRILENKIDTLSEKIKKLESEAMEHNEETVDVKEQEE